MEVAARRQSLCLFLGEGDVECAIVVSKQSSTILRMDG